jgi:hypothetical protein
VHVNLGQSGFVFIEANVKKWGLAPVTGSLAPPPPYGSEQGSILLETGSKDAAMIGQGRPHRQSVSGSPYTVTGAGSNLITGHGRTRSGNFRVLPPTSPGPVRSPTDISLAQLVPNDEGGEPSGRTGHQEEYHDENPLHLHLEDATNPPPEYASPTHSDSERGRRYSTDSEENTPLIRVMNRSPGNSTPPAQITGQVGWHSAPVPSYSDAVRDGAGIQIQRRDSPASEASNGS